MPRLGILFARYARTLVTRGTAPRTHVIYPSTCARSLLVPLPVMWSVCAGDTQPTVRQHKRCRQGIGPCTENHQTRDPGRAPHRSLSAPVMHPGRGPSRCSVIARAGGCQQSVWRACARPVARNGMCTAATPKGTANPHAQSNRCAVQPHMASTSNVSNGWA